MCLCVINVLSSVQLCFHWKELHPFLDLVKTWLAQICFTLSNQFNNCLCWSVLLQQDIFTVRAFYCSCCSGMVSARVSVCPCVTKGAQVAGKVTFGMVHKCQTGVRDIDLGLENEVKVLRSPNC